MLKKNNYRMGVKGLPHPNYIKAEHAACIITTPVEHPCQYSSSVHWRSIRSYSSKFLNVLGRPI